MSDWRDDLPEIPSGRILRAAIHEGHRRHEARRRRQQAVMYGGMGVGAIALLIGFGALLSTGGDDDDDSGAADTAAATTAAAGTTTGGTEAAGTTGAPGTTAASGATTGTTGAATTSPDYTTVGGPIAGEPPSGAVTVNPTEIWEQPTGGADCGPTTLTVVFDPRSVAPQTPVVHWETAGVQDEMAMDVDDGTARATIAPFPPETLETGTNHEVLVYVTDADATGDEIFRSPTVTLRDCSP
jgi:hypothetical protein